MRRPKRLLALLWLAALSASTPAQSQDYEQLYGPIVEASLASLARDAGYYDGRGVRTTGRIDADAFGAHRLSDRGFSVEIRPMRAVASAFDSAALEFSGERVELVGVFSRSERGGLLSFWEFVGPSQKGDGELKAADTSLESLVTAAGQRDGQMVRVVGQFRGRNLYRDLPSSSQKRSDDWVLNDDGYAIWVSGKKPRGSGFRLDPGLKRDTGKWLEVTGRATTSRSVTYVRAERIRLIDAPKRADAGADPAATPPQRARQAPVVVFSLPLDGEQIPEATLFQLQFSKDMGEDSFTGRVVLRYAGERRAGDRLFDGVHYEYDGGLRVLTIDPGDTLRLGREVQLLLLEGIEDIEGMSLEAREGIAVGEEEVVDVLRFVVTNGIAQN
jgi:hypothetical protein